MFLNPSVRNYNAPTWAPATTAAKFVIAAATELCARLVDPSSEKRFARLELGTFVAASGAYAVYAFTDIK